MRRALVLVCALAVACLSCSGDDDDAASTTTDPGAEPAARFCDVYLDYLSESTSANLTAVEEASGDDQVGEYVDVMESEADIVAIVAATVDLDALVAGDPIGARNVASANAIAVFEPWEPIPTAPDAGTPAIGDIDGQSFTIALDPASLAECQVETGVVVACQIAE